MSHDHCDVRNTHEVQGVYDVQSQNQAPRHLRSASPDSYRPPKYTRQRSASPGTAFYSTAVLPVHSHNEILASLITSLTALTDSAQQQLHDPDHLDENTHDRKPTNRPTNTSEPSITPCPIDHEEDLFDGYHCSEIAPAPVAGYSTRDPFTASQSHRTKWSVSRNKKPRPIDPRKAKSSHSLRRPSDLGSELHLDGFSTHNDSVGSLPLSDTSRESDKSPSKMLFSSSLKDGHNGWSITSIAEYRDGDPHRMSPSNFDDLQPGHDMSNESATLGTSPSPPTQEGSVVSGHKTISVLDPSARDDLGEHLIPSRMSSLKYGERGSKHARNSVYETKNLELDEQLVAEDDSTVRRIRELQQARETRNLEWRKEARKSERAAKRMSLPSPPHTNPTSPQTSVRRSVSEMMVGKFDPDDVATDRPLLRKPGGAAREAKIPQAPTKIPLGPLSPRIEPIVPKRDSSISPSVSRSTSFRRTHKRIFSGGLPRSISEHQTFAEVTRPIGEAVETFLRAPRLTQRIRHPRTGRTIAFSEVGDPQGFAVVCCVGMGLTRYMTTFYDELAKTQKLRLITPDRPGVGDSEPLPDGTNSPLSWVDDVAIICSALNVDKFSLLAHSAGSIYALATALKMPQYIRGRIHLLAPWIPASQFSASSLTGEVKAADLPTSYKLLSMLPATIMKAANSRFLMATSPRLDCSKPRKPRKKDRSASPASVQDGSAFDTASLSASEHGSLRLPPSPTLMPPHHPLARFYTSSPERTHLKSPPLSPVPFAARYSPTMAHSQFQGQGPAVSLTSEARQKLYDKALAERIWALSTTNANPGTDLIVCFERKKAIGFKYTDVTRPVVIHHGREDSRVPLTNMQWLNSVMPRCELRVVEDADHGLMSNASVMSDVLCEVAKEWEDWERIARHKEKKARDAETSREWEWERERERERERSVRRGPRW